MNITHQNYPHAKGYVNQWQQVIKLSNAFPDTIVNIAWNKQETAKETRRWFLQALHNRINFRGNTIFYKKSDVDWFYRYWRDQQAVQGWHNNRVIIHSFETRECRERFGNLIWNEEY